MSDDPRRALPAVHELASQALAERYGAARVTHVARQLLEEARAELADGKGGGDQPLDLRLAQRLALGVNASINATGVVLHTNLGRAPWGQRAQQRALQAMGYGSVELDTLSGQRGRRGAGVHERIAALTGAEAALVVNNCAAAVMLCLRLLARGRKVLVSRSELVEIGGGFRVPEILEESGATLVEVGTTNRTHMRDYEQALDDQVGCVLHVHHSNFRQVGFVTRPSIKELCSLGVPVLVDLGSGALQQVDDEPTIQEQLQQGANLVCFSGDKLLGGPQAGLVVGDRELIKALGAQPLMRALRAGKVTLAALEGTLDDWLLGTPTPVQEMIAVTPKELEPVVQGWLDALPDGVVAQMAPVEGAVGGGSVPGRTWPSVALAISEPSPRRLQRALLHGETPVVGRLHDGKLLLDARTVAPLGQAPALLKALLAALESK